jgi:hypothetical protein
MDQTIQPINYKEDFIPYIRTIVPVISNSFRLEEIFGEDEELCAALNQNTPRFYDETRTIDQQLTKKWADEIVEYPMSDSHNLARVSQYYQVKKKASDRAKMSYMSFLQDSLLKVIQRKIEQYQKIIEEGSLPDRDIQESILPRKDLYQDIYNQNQNSIEPWSFTKLVKELDLPTFPDKKDPLRFLAKLPLPIYVTTSYFRFIEEALKSEGKNPSTQYWSWIGKNPKLGYFPDPDQPDQAIPSNPTDYVRDYNPNPMRPVVYHLFGLEDFVKTLVLSEDDYMNFLMKAAENKKSLDVVPSALQTVLSENRLLLLGYHLPDWDFRALFQFISNFQTRAPGASQSIAIQLMPNLQNKDFENKSLEYLKQYFDDYNFEVKWRKTETFILELVDAYTGKGLSGGD